MNQNENDCIETRLKCLKALVASPGVVSFIDEDIVDELEDEGFFDPSRCRVTDKGREYIRANS